jgi:hypothetical protein
MEPGISMGSDRPFVSSQVTDKLSSQVTAESTSQVTGALDSRGRKHGARVT